MIVVSYLYIFRVWYMRGWKGKVFKKRSIVGVWGLV